MLVLMIMMNLIFLVISGCWPSEHHGREVNISHLLGDLCLVSTFFPLDLSLLGTT